MSEPSSKPSSEALHAPQLDAAIAAARAIAEQGADDGAATRLRLRETFSERGAIKRKRRTMWLAGAIAALLGSTAFAHYAGWKLPGTTATQPRLVTQQPAPAPVAPPTITQQPAPTPVAPPTITQQPAPTPVAPPTITQRPVPTPVAPPTITQQPVPTPVAPSKHNQPPIPTAIVRVPAPAITPAPALPQSPTLPGPMVATQPAEPTQPTQVDAELQLYRTAHEIHFHQNNPTDALAAWNAYLAAYPDGRLALEARYARAVALVKLERWQDARSALAPFATAPTGAYRQREAVQLLDAISKLSATPPR
ncbi:MAG TPA: tetratricopeptide repeat protein [Kofleriaceae bacterium]|nr:tetratricopeptide repeat protein [Kofleriaceae bacterium]